MNAVLNIAAYRFVELDDPAQIREAIHAQASSCGLRGTVLLATEGINLVIAGAEEGARRWMDWLQTQPPFAGLEFKLSWSEQLPFNKLIVKVKREIIRMNRPAIQPQQRRAPSVDPATLKRWLDAGIDDEGRPVVTLDTRNAFEVDHGRFHDAHDWRIERFSEFPQALQQHRAEFDGKTVVSYCTGGIRCEKAALLMLDEGLEKVYQLEGGILAYLEKTPGTHFEGNCFVFDQRELLDDRLRPAG